ncbi:alpha/beta hydrolase [Pseudodonghicola flavimaris]|uniref:Alpha/beta hydrolase n=1 Tax=Pseudodonghicola flavimaris TaxID=3050036 RepID=A0ABT7F544_9RHOB|nr:alpha/beta hydrolase [Pseudodonghicola flavimaris]MDK3019733.1 alpha/beta hydrolase [Pseudodonghicola flavimaris]
MSYPAAPLFTDVAEAPDGGAAHWLTASDGVRIRIGHWRPSTGARGTVLLFPGRTEYVEKYGPAAGDLAARGLATLAIDWRGQGLADRLQQDPRPGHIGHFADYQKDVAAALESAIALDLPQPFFLVAHSMGGCIGLRALTEGLPVAAAAFTGPMWDIDLSPPKRLLARWVTSLGLALGQGNRLMLSTRPDNYVLYQPFDDNALTTDPEMYRFMQRQLQEHPDLGLGGPSMRWLNEALQETTDLARQPAPDLPCLTFLGTAESIVSARAIRTRMAGWPRGRLEMVEGARHEVMMEGPATRARAFDQMAAFFSEAAGA